MSLPENQRKLDAADQLAKLADGAGLSLIEMAIAFVLRRQRLGQPLPPALGPPPLRSVTSVRSRRV